MTPELNLALAAPGDADDCLALRAAVTAELLRNGTPELCLARESDDEFRAFFADPDSCAYVARDVDGTLAGFGIATYRGASRLTFRDLIADFDRSSRYVGYVKVIQASAAYRGRGLQRRFFAALEAWLAACGSRYACGTVSPDNIASLVNFLRSGYKIKDLRRVQPEGYARLSMVKELA